MIEKRGRGYCSALNVTIIGYLFLTDKRYFFLSSNSISSFHRINLYVYDVLENTSILFIYLSFNGTVFKWQYTEFLLLLLLLFLWAVQY